MAALKGNRECVQPAAFVPEAPCNGPNTESCSDNLSIMRTVESLLATAVNRCVGRICDLAETEAQPLQVPDEPLAYRNNHGAERAGDATTRQAAQEG